MKKFVVKLIFLAVATMLIVVTLPTAEEKYTQKYGLKNSDSILALSATDLLTPKNPVQEAENFLRFMHAQQHMLLKNDRPSVDIDDLVDTTGALYNYRVETNHFYGKWFEIYATGKKPAYGNFRINTRGELSSAI